VTGPHFWGIFSLSLSLSLSLKRRRRLSFPHPLELSSSTLLRTQGGREFKRFSLGIAQSWTSSKERAFRGKKKNERKKSERLPPFFGSFDWFIRTCEIDDDRHVSRLEKVRVNSSKPKRVKSHFGFFFLSLSSCFLSYFSHVERSVGEGNDRWM